MTDLELIKAAQDRCPTCPFVLKAARMLAGGFGMLPGWRRKLEQVVETGEPAEYDDEQGTQSHRGLDPIKGQERPVRSER